MTFCELWRLYQKEKGSRWDDERLDFIEDFYVYFDDIKYRRVEKTSAKRIESIFKKKIREEVRLHQAYDDYTKYLSFLNTILWFYSLRVKQGFRISGLANLTFDISKFCKRNKFCTYENLHRKEQDERSALEARKKRIEKRLKKRKEMTKMERLKIKHQKKSEARRQRHHKIAAYLGKKATLKRPSEQEDE